MTSTPIVPAASTDRVLPSPPGRRGIEFALLVFALLIATAADAAVALAHDGKVSSSVGRNMGELAIMYLLAHLAIRWLAPHADPLLLPVVALLNGLGLAMIHRLDLAIADRVRATHGTMPRPDAPAQLVWTGIGLAVFVVVLLVVRHSRSLAAYMYTIALAGIVLLMLPAVPGIGSTINGERLWVRLGPVSFQPSELAKICLLVFFASYLVVKREVLSTVNRRLLGIALPRARDLGPVLVAWGASLAVLVVERDLGSSLLFFGLFISVLYIATERTSWLLLGLLLFLVGSWAAYESFAHVRERFEIWLHPFRYYSDQSYQLVQGLFGLASGGLLGSGLGRGHPALVPFSRTDFITAALGEELGVAGLMAVLLLFALLITRSLRAGLGTADPFGTLLAAGIGAALALQVFVVVGGVTALIPLTGLTLPFVSYGGSSLVANFAILALVMRVSDEGRRPPSVPARPAPPRPVDADLPTTSIRLPAAPTSAGGRGRAAGRESA